MITLANGEKIVLGDKKQQLIGEDGTLLNLDSAIVEYKGKWYLFHHDCVPSGGKTWLRSLKVVELEYDAEGKIITIDGGGE